MSSSFLDRRRFMAYCSSLGLSGTLFPGALYAEAAQVAEETDDPVITTDIIKHAEAIAGLSFDEEEREMMVDDLNDRLEDFEAIRALEMPNEVSPALVFQPQMVGPEPPPDDGPLDWSPPEVTRPASDEDLAYLPVTHLSALLRNGEVTATELTELYLRRLKRYDGKLNAVITYTEERARAQAAAADEELANGIYRGPLHGIPWGAKDLLAVEGYPTTWGAEPYRNQTIDHTAAAVRKLDEAGAILIAKLSLGALAWGDVWFDARTNNPWNLDQGASGSSAGPGAAVAAGLVGFAIGSETLGSIVSPSTRNGVTGFRPSFGTVSRDGAMVLSWSMDKLGPMARAAEDCALVYDALRGADPADPATVDAGFSFTPGTDVTTLRVGYLQQSFEAEYGNEEADAATLDVLRDLGVELHPLALPDDVPAGPIVATLWTEAAAAFDDLTRSEGIDTMVRQTRDAWPHVFRAARFMPAVEFIQMNRARTLLMERMRDTMAEVDVLVTPSFVGGTLQVTNLTGHPCVCVPNAFHPVDANGNSPRRSPGSITFVGQLYGDAAALQLARAFQQATDFHTRRPPLV